MCVCVYKREREREREREIRVESIEKEVGSDCQGKLGDCRSWQMGNGGTVLKSTRDFFPGVIYLIVIRRISFQVEISVVNWVSKIMRLPL